MVEETRKIAAELRKFLTASGEEDFLVTGAGAGAAPVSLPHPQKENPVSENPVMPKPAAVVKTKTASAAAVSKEELLAGITKEIQNCRRCPLGSTRLNAVPGEGNINAEIMFIGEGPGFDEDHKGRPFIGRAGTLLTKMIEAMGLKREDVFIGNIAKCHPMIDPSNPEKHGNDRAPDASEIASCRRYIERQIAAISPKYIVALGGVSAKTLIMDSKSLGALRGKFFDLNLNEAELKTPVKIMATYHPAALLRNPGWKKDAWADLQMLMKEAGLKGKEPV